MAVEKPETVAETLWLAGVEGVEERAGVEVTADPFDDHLVPYHLQNEQKQFLISRLILNIFVFPPFQTF